MTSAAQFTPQTIRTTAIDLQQEQFTLAMHQEAENALAMALHYLRSGGHNVPGATRKAVQALGALNRLEMLSMSTVAQLAGHA